MKKAERNWRHPGDLVKAVQEQERTEDEGFEDFLRSPEPEVELMMLLTEFAILAKQVEMSDLHLVVSAYGFKIQEIMQQEDGSVESERVNRGRS